MSYPDDFNERVFSSSLGFVSEHLQDDFDFLERRVAIILAEMVQAVRPVVSRHGLSFFNESEGVLKEIFVEEFLWAYIKMARDAIEDAGFEVPEVNYDSVAPLHPVETIAAATKEVVERSQQTK